MKHMAKKGKIVVKKWFSRSKRGYLGVKKMRVGDQSRKAKWCKMQVLFPKTDKTNNEKS